MKTLLDNYYIYNILVTLAILGLLMICVYNVTDPYETFTNKNETNIQYLKFNETFLENKNMKLK